MVVAKWCAKAYRHRMCIAPRSEQDVENMRSVLGFKIAQHPELEALLLATGDACIVPACMRTVWRSASERRRGIDLSCLAAP